MMHKKYMFISYKEKKWKIEGVKALAGSGHLTYSKKKLEKLTEKGIDSLIKNDDPRIKSKEDFKRILKKLHW